MKRLLALLLLAGCGREPVAPVCTVKVDTLGTNGGTTTMVQTTVCK